MNSPIKHKNMHELSEYQRYLWEHPKLKYLFFELTDKCNLRCRHCGSGCNADNSNYLPFNIVEKVLTDVSGKYDPKKIMVCITGGEPFLHPDLPAIIRLAKSLGFQVGITSNGTLITDDNAVFIKKPGLDTIAISIDGIGDIHDSLRQVKGCFEKAMSGIHSLKKAGIEPQALTVVHKDNISSLEEIYEYLKKEDIYSWRLVNIEPIGRAAADKDLLLDGSELKQLYEFIHKKRFDSGNDMEVTYGCSHFLTYEYENELRDYYFQCGAGTQVASIMADGRIGACLDIERLPELIQGNIYEDTFTDIWENRFEVFRKDRTESSDFCSKCPHKTVCLGDSAHTWNYRYNEPDYCVAKMISEV